jgi:hypothetical protein
MPIVAQDRVQGGVPWLVTVEVPLGRRLFRTIARGARPEYAPAVRAFALVELGDSEAIDLFLREEDARRALAECLKDEPEWLGMLYVEPIELDKRGVSAN